MSGHDVITVTWYRKHIRSPTFVNVDAYTHSLFFQQCIMSGGSRSREGCFNCRKRKRRCDEEKPICQRCRKIGDDCVFPSSSNTFKFVVVASDDDHHMIPITQNISFLNLSTQELVAINDSQGGVVVQRSSLPRVLSPFPYEMTGIENALVQYCTFALVIKFLADRYQMLKSSLPAEFTSIQLGMASVHQSYLECFTKVLSSTQSCP
jgi:hypothetical protein